MTMNNRILILYYIITYNNGKCAIHICDKKGKFNINITDGYDSLILIKLNITDENE